MSGSASSRGSWRPFAAIANATGSTTAIFDHVSERRASTHKGSSFGRHVRRRFRGPEACRKQQLENDFEGQDDLAIVSKAGGDSWDEVSAGSCKTVGAHICGRALHIQVSVVEEVVRLSSELQLCSFPGQRKILEQCGVLEEQPRLTKCVARKRAVEGPIH